MRTRSLRSRALGAFALLGALYIAILVPFMFMAYQMGREAVLQTILTREYEFARAALEAGASLESIRTPVSDVYAGVDALPEPYRSNLHLFEDEDYDVPVREWQETYLAEIPTADGPVFLLIDGWAVDDAGFFLPNLVHVSLSVLIVSVLVAAWASFTLADRLAGPANSLARRIRSYSVAREQAPVAAEVADRDLLEVARAFDQNVERIRDLVDREKEFTRNASHELRTPITVARGACEVIQKQLEGAGEPVQGAIRRALEGLEEMGVLVETFLLLAREEQQPELLPVARVGDVVRRIVSEAQSLARPNVRVESLVECDLLESFPEVLFRIAAENLVRNALLFTESGTVTVRLTPSAFEVEDTGPGVPEELRDRLLEPLVKSAQSPGSGVGLSIVRRIAERCGWRLEWDSRSGEGSRFRILFSTAAATSEGPASLRQRTLAEKHSSGT